MKLSTVSIKVLPVLILFSMVNFAILFVPNRQVIVDIFGSVQNILTYWDLAGFFVTLLVHGFFYGWVTDIIVYEAQNKEGSLVDSLGRIALWLPRSVAILIVGPGGLALLTLGIIPIAWDSIFVFLATMLGGLWITLTFTFYPTVIASQQLLSRSFVEAFSVNLRSVSKWFHLLLFLFLISGGFVYIWIPKEIAKQYTSATDNLSGWMVHFQWLGGYSFQPYWFSDYAKSLETHPSNVILAICFFLTTVVTTLVRIRVTRILARNGYLTDVGARSSEVSSLEAFDPRANSSLGR